MFFCKDKRPEAKANLISGARPAEVMKELGKMWGALKGDSSRAGELASYHTKAAEDKERVWWALCHIIWHVSLTVFLILNDYPEELTLRRNVKILYT